MVIGINLIIVTIPVSIVGVILGSIASNMLHSALPSIFAALVSGILFVLGCWLLTAPDPSGLGEGQYGTSRRIVRIALLIGLVVNVISLAPNTQTVHPAVHFIVMLFAAVSAAAGIVSQFAMLNYLSKLALRIPDERMSNRAQFLKYAFSISYSWIVLQEPFHNLLRSLFFPDIAISLLCGVLALAALLFAIGCLVLIVQLGMQFKEAEFSAIQTWSSARS